MYFLCHTDLYGDLLDLNHQHSVSEFMLLYFHKLHVVLTFSRCNQPNSCFKFALGELATAVRDVPYCVHWSLRGDSFQTGLLLFNQARRPKKHIPTSATAWGWRFGCTSIHAHSHLSSWRPCRGPGFAQGHVINSSKNYVKSLFNVTDINSILILILITEHPAVQNINTRGSCNPMRLVLTTHLHSLVVCCWPRFMVKKHLIHICVCCNFRFLDIHMHRMFSGKMGALQTDLIL